LPEKELDKVKSFLL